MTMSRWHLFLATIDSPTRVSDTNTQKAQLLSSGAQLFACAFEPERPVGLSGSQKFFAFIYCIIVFSLRQVYFRSFPDFSTILFTSTTRRENNHILKHELILASAKK